MEFMALATHRKVIRAELAAYAEQFRKAQLDSLRDHLEEVGIDTKAFPPEALVVAMAALASTIIMEEALGMETGLRETRDLVERFLTQYEGPPEPRVRCEAGQEAVDELTTGLTCSRRAARGVRARGRWSAATAPSGRRWRGRHPCPGCAPSVDGSPRR